MLLKIYVMLNNNVNKKVIEKINKNFSILFFLFILKKIEVKNK